MSDYLDEVKPHVKPSRDELLRAIGDALADSWSDVEEYAEAPEAIADAVLALFNGKTEQDYHPIQVFTGGPFGWFSGDSEEMCPECFTKLMGKANG